MISEHGLRNGQVLKLGQPQGVVLCQYLSKNHLSNKRGERCISKRSSQTIHNQSISDCNEASHFDVNTLINISLVIIEYLNYSSLYFWLLLRKNS